MKLAEENVIKITKG